MKLRIGVLFTVAATFVCVCQSEASAAGPTTILPSRAEIRAVPAPGQGRLVAYALNIHPGARLIRGVLGR